MATLYHRSSLADSAARARTDEDDKSVASGYTAPVRSLRKEATKA